MLVAKRRFAAADLVLGLGMSGLGSTPSLLAILALSAQGAGRFALARDRWKAAILADPDDPRSRFLLASAMRAIGDPLSAEVVVRDALERFPDDHDIAAEAARVAMSLGRLDEALIFWRRANARDLVHPDCRFGEIDTLLYLGRVEDADDMLVVMKRSVPDYEHYGEIERRLDLARRRQRDERASAAFRQPAFVLADDEIAIDLKDLFSLFESIGDNCEFGLIQRVCGADNLALLRFASSRIETLLDALPTAFDRYGVEGDLEYQVDAHTREYMARSRHYDDFFCHTEALVGADLGRIAARDLKTIAYLKSKFFEERRIGERILVRKGASIEDARRILDFLKTFGPNRLLLVREADDAHERGRVDVVDEDLLVGYVSRFAGFAWGPILEIEDWRRICLETLNLDQAGGADRQRYRVSDNRVRAVGTYWDVVPCCETTMIPVPDFEGEVVERIKLTVDTPRSRSDVAHRFLNTEFEPRSPVVFSLWVFVPKGFQGTFVEVGFINAKGGYQHRAHLDDRDVWQRIWTSTTMPRGQRCLSVALRITGQCGDAIALGPWRLEEGHAPNPWPLRKSSAADRSARCSDLQLG